MYLFSDVAFEEIEQYTLNKEWDIEINHVRQMTLEDIEKELGYEIELI